MAASGIRPHEAKVGICHFAWIPGTETVVNYCGIAGFHAISSGNLQ